MDKKRKDECQNPNCRLPATKKHPKENRGLCDQHYAEVLCIIEAKYNGIITLTQVEEVK